MSFSVYVALVRTPALYLGKTMDEQPTQAPVVVDTSSVEYGVRQAAELVKTQPLSVLTPVIHEVALRFAREQDENNGLVPIDILVDKMRVASVYTAIEVLPVFEGRCYLKMRESGDQGWSGLYHIPGKILRRQQTFDSVLGEIATECFGVDQKLLFDRTRLSLLDLRLRTEHGRGNVDCFSVLYRYELSDHEEECLSGTWQGYTKEELPNAKAIDHHIVQLTQALSRTFDGTIARDDIG
jgi:hypothetical protein